MPYPGSHESLSRCHLQVPSAFPFSSSLPRCHPPQIQRSFPLLPSFPRCHPLQAQPPAPLPSSHPPCRPLQAQLPVSLPSAFPQCRPLQAQPPAPLLSSLLRWCWLLQMQSWEAWLTSGTGQTPNCISVSSLFSPSSHFSGLWFLLCHLL